MSRIICFIILTAGLTAAGCGKGNVPVKGIVTLDGTPVEGATVTYVAEDGKQQFTGYTDAGGNFELAGPDKPGALPGNYKVTVMKGKKMAGAEGMTPGSPEYTKQMEKMAKESAKSGPKPGMPGLPAGPGQSSGVKSELPSKYATTQNTPLTGKVPPDSQPVKIELTSK